MRFVLVFLENFPIGNFLSIGKLEFAEPDSGLLEIALSTALPQVCGLFYTWGALKLTPGRGSGSATCRGTMDLNKTLNELREERGRIEEAILSLERLILSRGKRGRGRPPKWLSEARKVSAGNHNHKDAEA
jgi:hypothetical protein